MAFPSTAVIEVRTTGSDSNGGGFDPVLGAGATDYSQQASAQATGTVTSSTTTVTATASIFTAQMVGNYITDGTTWKVITAFTNATTVTVDSAPTWTAATINVGGALATIAKAAAIGISGNIIWVAAGTYTPATTTTISTTCRVLGYNTTRSTAILAFGSRPLIQAGANSITLIALTGARAAVSNFQLSSNSHTSVIGVSCSNSGHTITGIHYVLATGNGIAAGGTTPTISRCYVSVNGNFNAYAITTDARLTFCYADLSASASGTGFSNATGAGTMSYCTFRGPASGTSIGFDSSVLGTVWVNCTARGAGSHGFHTSALDSTIGINCLAYSCGGFGFSGSGVSVSSGILVNCAGGSNTSGNTTGFLTDNFTALSADPNISSTNLGLNASNPGGANLRAASISGAFDDGTSTSFLDIGSVQHADPTQPTVDKVLTGTVYNDGQSTGTLTASATTYGQTQLVCI